MDYGPNVQMLDRPMPSYEICPSCGFEFGFDDLSEGETYESYRCKWIANGCRWWSQSRLQAADWDLRAQLRNVGINLSNDLKNSGSDK